VNFGDERFSDHFWKKLSPCPMSGCWLYTWELMSDDNRHFRAMINGRDTRVHVELAKAIGLFQGDAGHRLIRKCGNDICCNPYHLARGIRSKTIERDLAGQRFGHWLVIQRVENQPRNTGSYRRLWLCECKCGTRRNVRESTLAHDGIKSCGCATRRNTSMPWLVVDLTGRRFGLLTVVKQAETVRRGESAWFVRCDCGKEKVVSGSGNLRRAKSCGCVNANRTHGAARRKKDGEIRRMGEYGVWMGMIRRCIDPKTPRYADYGGRGITVSERWRGSSGYVNFLSDVGHRPPGKKNGRAIWSLDRIDPNGNYEPGNVRWATQREQMQNTRTAKERVAAVLDKFKDAAPSVVEAIRRELLGAA
jgi:hypothetical protein